MKTYKVLTRNDHWLFGKFDPTELEMNLNNLARQGWRVVSTCTNDVWAWLGNRRQEIVVILEKDI